MSCEAPRTFIVLSTYNGERYLREQLESIRRQSVTRWRLLVRDDGSTDGTAAMLGQAARHDRRIELLRPDGRNLGAPASFGVLLGTAYDGGAEHVFLADQDDIWLPDKLARQLDRMAQVEGQVGRETPVLVHSDLRVVGDDLNIIHPSFRAYQHLDRERSACPLRTLLAQNFVTGCAALVNRALLSVAVPIPTVVMHDWWLAQCAAAVGVLAFLDEPTVLYRQHGANAIGASGLTSTAARALRRPGAWWARGSRNFLMGIRQAGELEQRVRQVPGRKAASAMKVIEDYVGAFTAPGSPWRRIGAIMRLGVQPLGAISRVLFVARVLLYSHLERATT